MTSAVWQSDSVTHLFVCPFSSFLLHHGLSQSIGYISLGFTARPSSSHSVKSLHLLTPKSTGFLVSGVGPSWVRLFQSLVPGCWVGPDLVALDSGKMSASSMSLSSNPSLICPPSFWDPRESHSFPCLPRRPSDTSRYVWSRRL